MQGVGVDHVVEATAHAGTGSEAGVQSAEPRARRRLVQLACEERGRRWCESQGGAWESLRGTGFSPEGLEVTKCCKLGVPR